MEHFAGLDISMKETHICVMDRDGKVVLEAKAATSTAAIAAELARAPALQRIVFETGRMATTLYHGLEALTYWVIEQPSNGGSHRAIAPGTRHYRMIRTRPRLPDVHTWHISGVGTGWDRSLQCA